MIAYALTIAIATRCVARFPLSAWLGVFILSMQGTAGTARAEVMKVDIVSRADVLGGRPFGEGGASEKIIGTVFFALGGHIHAPDPALPANRGIADFWREVGHQRAL
jgi:hypothetical protein